MTDLSVLLLFAGACVALTLTPGPDMLLIASRSMSQGRASGFVSLAGIQVGTYCHALAAVRFAGAAYLVFLAWKALSAPLPLRAEANLAPTPLLSIFRQGVVTNLLNPKMALFVLALFPQFVDPTRASLVAQMLIFATVLNVIGLLVNGAVILLASRIGLKLATNAHIAKRLNQILGAVFFGLACRLALVSGR